MSDKSSLRPIGWMAKQAEEIRKEMATWPRWMQLAAQFGRRPLPEDEEARLAPVGPQWRVGAPPVTGMYVCYSDEPGRNSAEVDLYYWDDAEKEWYHWSGWCDPDLMHWIPLATKPQPGRIVKLEAVVAAARKLANGEFAWPELTAALGRLDAVVERPLHAGEHEWVPLKNEHVESGEFCLKCYRADPSKLRTRP